MEPQALRKEWNRVKAEVAPWWAGNSKEAYASGIGNLVTGLDNWKSSKSGGRRGAKVGFPRFQAKNHDPGRVRFTTGTMRFGEDRRTIAVPVIGPLRAKENTRRVQRPVAQGRAHILNMTVSERWGRLFVSVNYAIRTPRFRPVARRAGRAGVDLGLRSLATVADTEGDVIEFPNPAPLRATLNERRTAGRALSRRIPGSIGHRAAIAKLARLDRRAVSLRQEANHHLTSWLAGQYGEVVVEDLDLAAMKKAMAKNLRDWPDHASLGLVEAQAPNVSCPASGGGVVGSDTRSPGAGGATVSHGVRAVPVVSEARTDPENTPGEEPRERGAGECARSLTYPQR